MTFRHLLKQVYIVAMAIVVTCTGAGCMAQHSQSEAETGIITTGEFNLADYQWGITEFPADDVLSRIENTEDLIGKAKQLWREKLQFLPEEEYVIRTYYDDESDCWMVTAELDDAETDYAVPTVIIYTNGTVAAVWRE